MSTALEPRHIRPQQWHQAVDVSRETCARLFAAGRSPADALRAYGMAPSGFVDWAHAVNVVAEIHYEPRERRRVA
jgi:hypothetical protein